MQTKLSYSGIHTAKFIIQIIFSLSMLDKLFIFFTIELVFKLLSKNTKLKLLTGSRNSKLQQHPMVNKFFMNVFECTKK